MILLSADLETTGLDFVASRPIEVGAILYSTGQKKCLESSGYLVKSDVPVPAFITTLTGITQSALDKFGYEPEAALDAFLDLADQADAIIGQNVKRFDKKMFEHWAQRHNKVVPTKLWIDTRTDLPGVESKHLGYMAADAGFLNLFPHSALSDCQTVLKLVEDHDITKVVERAQSPDIVLLAHQKFEDNHLAKTRKFVWNPTFKIWWKGIKQMDLDAEIAAAAAIEQTGANGQITMASFNVSIAPPEIPIEKLWYD